MRLDLLLSLAPGGSKEEMLVEQEPEEDEQVQVMLTFFIIFGMVQVFLLPIAYYSFRLVRRVQSTRPQRLQTAA